MPDVWLVYDKGEFLALFNSLKPKCVVVGITVEITKSTALHDDSPEYLFTSLCRFVDGNKSISRKWIDPTDTFEESVIVSCEIKKQ